MELLAKAVRAIDRLNDIVGRGVAWLTLAMVLVTFVVVILRYVFAHGWVWMQESYVWMHGLIFMLGAGYTLLHNGHVRVDIFYGDASERSKAWIDLVGVFVILLPVCAVVWWSSFDYVSRAWAVREGSVEVSGIQAIYLLKTAILVFGTLLALQGISMAVRSLFVLTGTYDRLAREQEAEDIAL